MDSKIRVSAISYLNSYPFLIGLKNHSVIKKIELSVDYPSKCAEKLITNQADIGLIPSAAIHLIEKPRIISDFCIGAMSKVRSVLLVCDVPLDDIKTVYLDFESRTSVALVQILAKHFWKKNFIYSKTCAGFESKMLQTGEAMVMIGDKALLHQNDHAVVFDLAEEWIKFSGLPFVFAFWVANKPIDEQFQLLFSLALEMGLSDLGKVAKQAVEDNPALKSIDILSYFTDNISYMVDEKKIEGYKLFSTYLKQL